MKLLGDLYTVTKRTDTESGVDYLIRLNPGSVIFKAHFPNHPVTPGACLVQLAQDLTETFLECPLMVRTIKNVKFLSVISPLTVQDLDFRITVKEDGDLIQSQVIVSDAQNTYAKLTLLCQKP